MATEVPGDIDPRLPGPVPRRDAHLALASIDGNPVARSGGDVPPFHQPYLVVNVLSEREAALGDGRPSTPSSRAATTSSNRSRERLQPSRHTGTEPYRS